MRILLIGHTGTIGKAIFGILKDRGHEIVTASRSGGDVAVDATKHESVAAMYEKVGEVDAVMVAAGSVPIKPLEKMTAADIAAGFQGKALSQIDIVLSGLKYVRGSFTLISGIMSDVPITGGAAAATANGAVNTFVMAAAAELKAGVRINAVSPTILAESVGSYGSAFPGFKPVAATDVAMTYIRSLEGIETGQIFRV